MIKSKCFPDKNMIVGHWHAWRIAKKCGHDVIKQDGENFIADCNSYVYTTEGKRPINITFIDGCSNYEFGGKVNAYVYETNATPIIY